MDVVRKDVTVPCEGCLSPLSDRLDDLYKGEKHL